LKHLYIYATILRKYTNFDLISEYVYVMSVQNKFINASVSLFTFLVKYLLFWLLLSWTARCIFLSIHYIQSKSLSVSELFLSFIYGSYLDLSLAGYITLTALLIFAGSYFYTNNFKIVFRLFTWMVIFILAITYATNILLYAEWGFPLDNTIFRYISTPNEAAEFISWKQYLLFGVITGIFMLIAFALIRKIEVIPTLNMSLHAVPACIVYAALLIIPIRGGLDLSPIRPGSAYFSNKMFANHSAVNPVWNLIYSTLQSGKLTNKYDFFLPDECDSLFAKHFHHPEIADEIFLENRQPNILFILLESFSAGMINQSFKGKEITPKLNKWTKKAIYFPNTYASGDRTDKGLISVFSGYPAQPQSSIMMEQKKSEKLPSLLDYLKNYNSVFYYGGDIKFAGMNSYLLSSGFQKIVDKSFFSSKSYNAKWGVHDHILFEKVLADLHDMQQPFVSGILTLSSHPPYDIPVESAWKGIDDESLFLSAAHYTDQSLGNFLDSLSTTDLWKNLLVVIVSDHGARIPGYYENQDAEKFRIPLLITGGAILKDSIITKPVSQTDIPVSLLHQLGKNSEKFIFSKDIFAKHNPSYAFYVFNNGMGWVDECGVRIYSLDKSDITFSEQECPSMIDQMKIYIQKLMKDYESK